MMPTLDPAPLDTQVFVPLSLDTVPEWYMLHLETSVVCKLQSKNQTR